MWNIHPNILTLLIDITTNFPTTTKLWAEQFCNRKKLEFRSNTQDDNSCELVTRFTQQWIGKANKFSFLFRQIGWTLTSVAMAWLCLHQLINVNHVFDFQVPIGVGAYMFFKTKKYNQHLTDILFRKMSFDLELLDDRTVSWVVYLAIQFIRISQDLLRALNLIVGFTGCILIDFDLRTNVEFACEYEQPDHENGSMHEAIKSLLISVMYWLLCYSVGVMGSFIT